MHSFERRANKRIQEELNSSLTSIRSRSDTWLQTTLNTNRTPCNASRISSMSPDECWLSFKALKRCHKVSVLTSRLQSCSTHSDGRFAKTSSSIFWTRRHGHVFPITSLKTKLGKSVEEMKHRSERIEGQHRDEEHWQREPKLLKIVSIDMQTPIILSGKDKSPHQVDFRRNTIHHWDKDWRDKQSVRSRAGAKR